LSKIRAIFNNSQAAIFGFIILSLGFDFIDKIEIFYEIDFIKFNRILKAIFLTYSIIFIISHVKYVQEQLKGLLFIIVLLSIVYVSKNNFSERYFFEYVRYVFILLVFPLLFYVYANKSRDLFDKLYKLFKWLIIINAFLILIGVLFEVKVFQTYKFDGRFAYNGLILSQGFTPFLYLCATTIFWVYKDKKMLLLLLTLCCLSGLKGVYFGEFLLLGLLVLSNKEFKKRFKIIILLILLIIFTTLLVTLLLTPMFVNVLESKGLTSAIFSYRTDNALEIFNQINENNFNILIGALETEVVRLEMQIFDVILFFGALGLVAYFLFLQLLYKKIVKDSVPKVFFATILALSALSGNLLYIPLSSLLMYLVLMSLHSPQKNE
jgi:hypothetical protein